MSNYEKQNFVKGQILKAEHLNHMEDGIDSLKEIIIKEDTNNHFICSHDIKELVASGEEIRKKRIILERLDDTYHPFNFLFETNRIGIFFMNYTGRTIKTKLLTLRSDGTIGSIRDETLDISQLPDPSLVGDQGNIYFLTANSGNYTLFHSQDFFQNPIIMDNNNQLSVTFEFDLMKELNSFLNGERAIFSLLVTKTGNDFEAFYMSKAVIEPFSFEFTSLSGKTIIYNGSLQYATTT